MSFWSEACTLAPASHDPDDLRRINRNYGAVCYREQRRKFFLAVPLGI